MTAATVSEQVLADLRSAVTGPVLTPTDADYRPEVSGFDLSLQHSPPVVVCAAAVDDVCATVRVAAANGLPIAVLGSGHGDFPAVTEGIMLSTRRLAAVEVDTDGRTAHVGAGATWHDVMAQTAGLGLAPLCGSAPAVGIGGFLLGGGLGPISRTYGFSSDHVVSFDIVDASGEARKVSASQEPDLFWALRGGKGGFGVVTAATIRLLELTAVYGGGEYYEAADIPGLLRAYQAFVDAGVPDELSTSIAILRLPDLPMLPPPLRGRTVIQLRVGYVGDGPDRGAEAELLLAPLRAASGSPLLGKVGELPYAEIGTIHNDPTVPSAHATGGTLLHRLAPETVDAILAVAGPDVASPLAIVEIRHFGGAIGPVKGPRDAVSGREAAFGMWVSGVFPPGSDQAAISATRAAVRGVIDAVAPWSTGSVQINFCGSVNTAREAALAWPAEVSDRLAVLRQRYDPHQVFPYVAGSSRPTATS